MNKRYILALFINLVMIISLAGCSAPKQAPTETKAPAQVPVAQAPVVTPTPVPEPAPQITTSDLGIDEADLEIGDNPDVGFEAPIE